MHNIVIPDLILVLNSLHNWSSVKGIPSHWANVAISTFAVAGGGNAAIVHLQETTNRVAETKRQVRILKMKSTVI